MARTEKTIPVVEAFAARQSHKTMANLSSTGDRLAFHGNVIAEWRGDRLFVRINGFGAGAGAAWNARTERGRQYAAGNFELSPVTRDWLSLIPGVSVYRVKGKLYLNGEVWDGLWKDVTDHFSLALTGNFADSYAAA